MEVRKNKLYINKTITTISVDMHSIVHSYVAEHAYYRLNKLREFTVAFLKHICNYRDTVMLFLNRLVATSLIYRIVFIRRAVRECEGMGADVQTACTSRACNSKPGNT